MGTPISEIIRAIKKEDDNEQDDVEEKKEEKMTTTTSSKFGLLKLFMLIGITNITVISAVLSSDHIQLIIPETGKINLAGILIVGAIVAGISVILSKLM